ncbi:uncharacterized protein LOC142179058 [Nicotiana tabacum]|uniref:Uncharacterized protein LOC142179058 n=1 Tax=Nicotiana tabacum TaxID=4097 RepID=A0AC58U665_TOBAC
MGDKTPQSSSSNSSSPIVPVNQSNIVQASKLISFNPLSQLSLKFLGSSNYSTSKSQVTTLLFGYDLLRFVDGSSTPTHTHIPDESNKEVSNNAFCLWLRQDSLARNAIMASVDPTIAHLIAHASTANHAWNILQTTYGNKSHSLIFILRDTPANLKKDSCSIGAYMKEIKLIVDDLASSGSPLSDEEIVIKVLSDLGSDYKELSAAIRARDNHISFEELYNKLLTYEMFIKHSEPKSVAPIITAQFHQKSHNSNSKNKNPTTFNRRDTSQANSNPNHNNTSQYPTSFNHSYTNCNNQQRIQCQLCDKYGHIAKIVDSRASHHITNNSQSLWASTEFPSMDEIIVGDESPPLHFNSKADTDTSFPLPTLSHLEQLDAQVTPEITSTPTIAGDMPPEIFVSLSSSSHVSSTPNSHTVMSSPSQSSLSQPQPRLQSFNHHITRAHNNIFKPKVIVDYLVVSSPKQLPLTPTTFSQAKRYLEWQVSMHDELTALLKNNTWSLVPSSSSHNIVGCKWVYHVKYKPDGPIDRFKASLVAKGFYQHPGVDYHHTFSLVIKHATIRLILTLVVSFKWHLHQLDVNNAFLQGTLNEVVYMRQPPGFVILDFPQHVCKLHKSIYGLRQVPRAWYNELKTFLLFCGFLREKSDDSLFIKCSPNSLLFVMIYVDDIVVTGSNSAQVQTTIQLLGDRFSIKDLGPLLFLRVEVLRNAHSLILTQSGFIADHLEKFSMLHSNSVGMPMSGSVALSLNDNSKRVDAKLYRQVVGSL